MVGLVLLLSGLASLAWGVVRGWQAARAALLPLAADGEPTRILIEASRPLYARSRVRSSARRAACAVLWLAVAAYGLFLAAVGAGTLR